MTDLSKIDFSRLTLPEWSGDPVRAVRVSVDMDGSVRLNRGAPSAFATLNPGDMVWRYAFATWGDLRVAKMYTDIVDKFIVNECARLAKEDDAANWVPVPWQDVEWLYEQRAVIKRRFSDRDAFEPLCDLEDLSGFHWFRFTADRRTFTAGYDPEKPRWVTVSTIDDLDRLRAAGATVRTIEVSLGYLCQVDAHTLKPGVPLHVEPPKLNLSAGMTSCATCGVTDCQAPSSPVDCGRYVREKKPEPRTCTREFALSHPDESESRYWSQGNGWSRWRIVAKNNEACHETEFCTTAAEPQKFEFAFSIPGDSGGRMVELPHGNWHIVATRVE